MARHRVVFIHQPEIRTSMKYYEKIIEQKPLAIDYMNAGHVAWTMGDIQKAAACTASQSQPTETVNAFWRCFGKTRKLFSNKVFKKRTSR